MSRGTIVKAGDDNSPTLMDLPAGEYWWCSCGRSRKLPFCDNSHLGSAQMPIKLRIREGGERVWLCNCKRSRSAPHCDGSHNRDPER